MLPLALVRCIMIGFLFSFAFLTGCVYQSGYVPSDYNKELPSRINAERMKMQDLQRMIQRLKEEIAKFQQEIEEINIQISKLETEANDLRKRVNKTLNDISHMRDLETEIKKLHDKVKEKSENIISRTRYIENYFRNDIS